MTERITLNRLWATVSSIYCDKPRPFDIKLWWADGHPSFSLSYSCTAGSRRYLSEFFPPGNQDLIEKVYLCGLDGTFVGCWKQVCRSYDYLFDHVSMQKHLVVSLVSYSKPKLGIRLFNLSQSIYLYCTMHVQFAAIIRKWCFVRAQLMQISLLPSCNTTKVLTPRNVLAPLNLFANFLTVRVWYQLDSKNPNACIHYKYSTRICVSGKMLVGRGCIVRTVTYLLVVQPRCVQYQ